MEIFNEWNYCKVHMKDNWKKKIQDKIKDKKWEDNLFVQILNFTIDALHSGAGL